MSPKQRQHDRLLAELTAALSERTEAAIAARVNLRDAVCAYVALEHERGVPLQKVIQTVKGLLRKAEEDTANSTDELAVQLVDWCVEFHRPPGSPKAVVLT